MFEGKEIIASFSVIPSRLPTLSKCVESMLNQTVPPDRIVINIPQYFRRFKCHISDDLIPRFDSKRVVINRCDDMGPGTKLLGSLSYVSDDSLLVLVDDDMEYDTQLVEHLSRCVLETNAASSFHVYQIKSRRSYIIGQGSDGFAIDGKHLRDIQSFFAIAQKNMHVWLNDDLWISFFLFLKGVDIVSCKDFCRSHVQGYVEGEVFTPVAAPDGLVEIKGRYARWRSLHRGVRYLERKEPWLLEGLGILTEKPRYRLSDHILHFMAWVKD